MDAVGSWASSDSRMGGLQVINNSKAEGSIGNTVGFERAVGLGGEGEEEVMGSDAMMRNLLRYGRWIISRLSETTYFNCLIGTRE